MNFLLCGLALAVLPASGELRQSHSAAPVTVYTSFEHAPQDALLSTIQEEVAAIMEPTGLHFDWRSLDAHSPNHVSVELIVLKFTGTCEANGPPLSGTDGTPLGRTHTSDGQVLPFVDVDCNRIRSFLGISLAAFEPDERSEVLGRAAARVIAHEFFHVLAHTRRHGSWGIAKSCYTIGELLGKVFRFEPREAQMLRKSTARLALESTESGAATGQ